MSSAPAIPQPSGHGHDGKHDHGSSHDHDHDHGEECCPFHESLSTEQVQRRLIVALYGGAILIAGAIVESTTNANSGLLLQLLSCAIMAFPILKDAFNGLKRRQLSFPSLVALAFCASLSQGDVFTAGLVAFFMIMADQLENRSAIGARLAIENLIRHTPDVVHLQQDGKIVDIDVKDLSIGQTIEIRPGEVLSIDGKITHGQSSVDESSITGESLPVQKDAGEPVYAGTVNLSGLILVQVEKTGDDTTVGKVQKLILKASQAKTVMAGIIEANSGWYTKTIVMLSVITWFFYREQSDALTRAIAILIMGCPCSLVLATPSVMIAAITAAARAGILVKRPQELESLHLIQHVFFDKTGTLTQGQMELTTLETFGELDRAQALTLAASLAKHSNHPHSQGLLAASQKARLELQSVEGFKESHGKGVQAQCQGRDYWLGREEWVLEQVGQTQNSQQRLVLGSTQNGILASFTFQDRVRPEAQQALKELKQLGIQQHTMVTGDHLANAEDLVQREQLNIDDIHARCLPEDKLKHLHQAKSDQRPVATVGDGINDAPLLAAAHVGIAMGAMGSPVAIESSSIALMSSDLSKLPFLFKLSQRTSWLIKVNIGAAVVILLLGLLLSSMGWLSPIFAAVLHNVSALFILFNSAQLVRAPDQGGHSPATRSTTTPSPAQNEA